MLHKKRIISTCMAGILAAGLVFNTGTVQALAAEETETPVFLTDVLVEVQDEEGNLHSADENVLNEAVLEVAEDTYNIYFDVQGGSFIFENEDGELEEPVLEVEAEEDEEEDITSYIIQTEDLTAEIPAVFHADEEQGEEFVFFVISLEPGDASAPEIFVSETEEAAEKVVAVTENETEEEEASYESISAARALAVSGSTETAVQAEKVAEEQIVAALTSALVVADQTDGASADVSGTASVSSVAPTAVKATDLADGKYTISIKGLEMDSDSEHSRAKEDLKTTAELVVADGNIDVYFTSTGRELTFQNSSGSFENKTVSKYEPEDSEIRSDGMNLSIENNYKVTVSSLDEEIIAKFPAGSSDAGYLTYRIVMDESTLQVVELANTGSSDESSDDSSESGSSSSGSGSSSSKTAVKTGDEAQILFRLILFMTAGMVMAYTMLQKRRKAPGIRI